MVESNLIRKLLLHSKQTSCNFAVDVRSIAQQSVIRSYIVYKPLILLRIKGSVCV